MKESPGHVSAATSAMQESPAHVGGAASAMQESPTHVGGAASAMQESPAHVGRATSEMQESPAHMGGAVGHLELGPSNNEKDTKRMETNGGIRPGKKWPQYLAAGLGTWLILCLMLRVSGRVQKHIADQLKVTTSFHYLLLFFFSHLSLYSLL
jgi:hypothetical protein